MRATWRPMLAWPYPERPKGRGSFSVNWTKTLDDLEKEIELAEGSDVLIGVVFADDTQFRLDGTPKVGFKVRYRGAEVSFDVPGAPRRVFHTDAFPTLQENLRAISLGLTALRAIDRYGITTSGEQYAGFAMLGAGGDVERGRELIAQHGTIAKALIATHPDHGGARADFDAVQAYREWADK